MLNSMTMHNLNGTMSADIFKRKDGTCNSVKMDIFSL